VLESFALSEGCYGRDENIYPSESPEVAFFLWCLQFLCHNVGKLPFMMSNLKCYECVQAQFKGLLSQHKSFRSWKKKPKPHTFGLFF